MYEYARSLNQTNSANGGDINLRSINNASNDKQIDDGNKWAYFIYFCR